jgi:quinoprotein glucose dehydrogenase
MKVIPRANRPGARSIASISTRETRLESAFGRISELAAQGTPITGTENYGGAIVTAADCCFVRERATQKSARSTRTPHGTVVWQTAVGRQRTAHTYTIKGRQFVVLASTGNKLGKQNDYGDAYVAFALPQRQTE